MHAFQLPGNSPLLEAWICKVVLRCSLACMSWFLYLKSAIAAAVAVVTCLLPWWKSARDRVSSSAMIGGEQVWVSGRSVNYVDLCRNSRKLGCSGKSNQRCFKKKVVFFPSVSPPVGSSSIYRNGYLKISVLSGLTTLRKRTKLIPSFHCTKTCQAASCTLPSLSLYLPFLPFGDVLFFWSFLFYYVGLPGRIKFPLFLFLTGSPRGMCVCVTDTEKEVGLPCYVGACF